jgi:hypothetical protein
MGLKSLKHPENYFSRDEFVLFDDFNYYVTADLWTAAVAGTGTVTRPATAGSDIRLLATADNDCAVLATTNEMFKFTASKAMQCEAELRIAPPQTNLNSWAFGWADAMAATTVADTTGLIAATDAAVITSVTGGLVLKFHTEINGTATTTTSSTSYVASTSIKLRIEALPVSSTVFELRPFADGVQLKDTSGVPIMHRVTLGTATDMDFGIVYKGHHADDGILLSDYIYAAQVR